MESKKQNNHEADIENENKKTSGENITYSKNKKNRLKQLQFEAEEKRLKEKIERDKRSNELNPNNPNYKVPKKV